jgi:hypothetical protein
MKSGKWTAIGGVVQGAAHIRQNKICQDALYVHRAEEGRFSLACVADGHGSERCPYSDAGAAAAVKITAEILAELLESTNPYATLTAHKDIRLPRQIEARWKETVKAIFNALNRDDIPPFSYELYGTTLLALVAAPAFIFALQIGDGDVVAIDPDGSARWLLPPCDHPGNETESLCMEDSWKYIRTQLIPINHAKPDADPLMFLLSTDGYANSFVNGEGFLKAGSDIHRLWRENGREYIEENLPHWLAQTSESGSGDDIAVAVLARAWPEATPESEETINEAV